jgi:hypothetical protein
MCKVTPSLTHKHLAMTVDNTAKGKGHVSGLPGVDPDAKRMDRKAHKANRDLAQRITEAVHSIKPKDKGKPRFVLGWRLYPNQENDFWKDAGGVHNCGCGCACFSNPAHTKGKAKGKAKR